MVPVVDPAAVVAAEYAHLDGAQRAELRAYADGVNAAARREPLPPDEASPDEVPITRLCFFIAPSPRAHLDLLARLSRSLTRGPLRELIANGAADEEILRVVETEDAAVTDPVKPGMKS